MLLHLAATTLLFCTLHGMLSSAFVFCFSHCIRSTRLICVIRHTSDYPLVIIIVCLCIWRMSMRSGTWVSLCTFGNQRTTSGEFSPYTMSSSDVVIRLKCLYLWGHLIALDWLNSFSSCCVCTHLLMDTLISSSFTDPVDLAGQTSL